MNTLVLAGDEGVVIVSIMGVAGAIVLIVAMSLDHWKKVATVRAREESRREIAAYVAEGSITADDAAKIISAGAPSRKSAAAPEAASART